jgi:2-keto-4-pentenoate hydratase
MRERNTKTSVPRIERAGEWLFEAHRARAPFAPMPAEIAPRDADEAYAIQSEFVGMRAASLGPVTGYKIALTTQAMRAMVGLNDSIAGDMMEKTILRSRPEAGTSVRAADYVRLIVEFEIGVEMAEDLPAIGAPYNRESVAKAVAALMPALELADDRNADYKILPGRALMLIADNAWNEGAVLGEPVRDWQGIDLAALQGVASINGKNVGTGHGRDVMGHPLDALAWLANNLAARGLGLWRGDTVITGSLVTSKFPKAGDLVRFDAGALGAVQLQVS